MDASPRQPFDESLPEVIIPKENAVFWMDENGRWCNRHGRFEHKRIIDYFNQAIDHDENGYFVTQIRGEVREKVYFPYVDTPLFVMRVGKSNPMELSLNTGRTIALDPRRLFTKNDQLYQRREDDVIKFSERALMEMAPFLDETSDGLSICLNGRHFPIDDIEAD